tara:strand:- start:3428 stop:4285 length:858 start_codon:yes stop_codon:yes gene_type:complete
MIKTKHKLKIASIIFKIIKFFVKIFDDKKDLHNLFIKRNGINWKLDLSEGIDLTIFLFGNSEKNLNNLQKLLPIEKKLIFIDIGANIGSTSINLAAQFKNSKIYAFEPTYYAFNKFKTNLNLNDELKKRVFPINSLVSNKALKNDIYSSWKIDEFGNKEIHKYHGGISKSFTDNFISLDSFVEKENIKNIDLIKIDVDGNEKNVIESSMKSLEKFKPIIFLEIAPYLYAENNYKFDDLNDLLVKFKYKYFTSQIGQISNIHKYVSKIKIGSSKNVFVISKFFDFK